MKFGAWYLAVGSSHHFLLVYEARRLVVLTETLRYSRETAEIRGDHRATGAVLHTQGPIAKALSYQILDSANSAGANYEEADDGSSPRDKRAKRMITLRELKETRFRLLVLRHSDILKPIHDPVLEESEELVRIVASIIQKTSGD